MTRGGARIGSGRKSLEDEVSQFLSRCLGYSLTRGVRALLDRKPLEGSETEAHNEALAEIEAYDSTSAMKSLLNPGLPHLLVPWRQLGIGRRDVTASGDGGSTIGEEIVAAVQRWRFRAGAGHRRRSLQPCFKRHDQANR
jgi:hypothetical protein